VPIVHRLVTSSMTSRDYDVILVTSQCSESSQSETRTRINYPCGHYGPSGRHLGDLFTLHLTYPVLVTFTYVIS